MVCIGRGTWKEPSKGCRLADAPIHTFVLAPFNGNHVPYQVFWGKNFQKSKTINKSSFEWNLICRQDMEWNILGVLGSLICLQRQIRRMAVNTLG